MPSSTTTTTTTTTTTANQKSACFDVLGTCFSFTTAITAIQTTLGPRLLEPRGLDAKTLFFSWFYAAQRDFTYISLAGSYTPIATILQETFRRACAIVDIPAGEISDEDIGKVMRAVKGFEAREGLKECWDGLRDAGWEVLGVTNGGRETSLGYFDQAGIPLGEGHLLSCDEIEVAKPDVRVYENANRVLGEKGLGDGRGQRWFVAAHAWDLIAAKKAGFSTAYLDFEEHDSVPAVFGKFDLYAGSMRELLGKMSAFT